jgi:C-3',4' desaturase CrtD
MSTQDRVVVIGAGVGGLTTAALLAQAGLDVTVLEAHVYPGGCAGTFYHKQYRFDAGATLAGGFYPGGPMDVVAQAAGIDAWPAHPSEPSMAVHLPGGASVTRYGDERRWDEHARVFGAASQEFFRWQERTADALWDLALRTPAWPPQSLRDGVDLVARGGQWLLADLLRRANPHLLADALRPVAAHLKHASPELRLYIDGQLLIAAQATSATVNALYGASALDLPRRGVVHLAGGIGAIARTLADAVRRHGGRVLYRHEVEQIKLHEGQPAEVITRRGDRFVADRVIANLPPWNIANLLGDAAPSKLRDLPEQPADGWGAFMVYVGVDESLFPAELPLHHQVIAREPLGEGNSVFLSLSPAWDAARAPAGKRALTISTHTALGPWWRLYQYDKRRYDQRKEFYVKRMLAAAERVIPGLRDAADLVMPGTPVTFQRFTRREWGWVGGFPQTNLFRAWAPRLAPRLWMVGDSIFPGQSTAAVALGGLRVARAILAEYGLPERAALRPTTTIHTPISNLQSPV